MIGRLLTQIRTKTPALRPLAIAAALTMAVGVVVFDADESRSKNRKLRIPLIQQATYLTEGEIYHPRVRSERAGSIVFVSDGDVLGPGSAPGHREVYYYDTVNNLTLPITTTLLGESYDAARETDATHSRRPVFVPFISTGNLDPLVGNLDGNPELFMWYRESGRIEQLTDTEAPVVNAQPYASDSGKCIVFRSSADLNTNAGLDSRNPGRGNSNPDGSDEVFVLDFLDPELIDRMFTQVSNGPIGTTSSNPVVGGFWFTRQCRSTTFQSDHDQVGNGSTGTMLYNYTRTSGALEQLSMPGAGSHPVNAISGASNFARGPFVPWTTDVDMLGNGSSNEIYRFRLFRSEIVQYSYGGGTGISQRPSISDGGGYIVFETTADIVDDGKKIRANKKGVVEGPLNADGNSEIVRMRGARRVWPITVTEGCENTHATVRDNGRSIAFRSTCDLVPGNNTSGQPQVFFYTEVPKATPMTTALGCTLAGGCCNQANGCFTQLLGAARKPPRPRVMRPEWNRGGTQGPN